MTASVNPGDCILLSSLLVVLVCIGKMSQHIILGFKIFFERDENPNKTKANKIKLIELLVTLNQITKNFCQKHCDPKKFLVEKECSSKTILVQKILFKTFFCSKRLLVKKNLVNIFGSTNFVCKNCWFTKFFIKNNLGP